jgi:hypothetical protein
MTEDNEKIINKVFDKLDEELGIVENMDTDLLKDELLKVYDELQNRGYDKEDLLKWINKGERLR